MSITLPIEILCEISLKTPAAYFILVQTCKAIAQPIDFAMKHFVVRVEQPWASLTTMYKLPNGELHVGINESIPSGEADWIKIWHYRNQFHRDNDLPASITHGGTLEWYYHGILHRGGDKPAYITSYGFKRWYHYGIQHRYDGPALTGPDGYEEYWRHGVLMYKN